MTAKKPPLSTLLLLMPFASISAVLFTPALPEIAKVLGVGDREIQSVMTLFLLGYAFGNLLTVRLQNGLEESLLFISGH